MTQRLDDGHSTRLSFQANPNVKLYEKEVTPPGVEGGGPVDTTTMRNATWRTMGPKKLKMMTDSSFVAAYDPAVYNEIIALINVNTYITVTFPDGQKIKFWGWLNTFNPGRTKEGEQPTAECTVHPSNMNASGVETAPVHSVA